MKKIILFAFSLCFSVVIDAQVSKTASLTAGSLSTALNTIELNTVTQLTLTGAIDARDFKTMRDNMPLLAELDLSGVNIVAYSGTEGTAGTSSFIYPADAIPDWTFKVFFPVKVNLTSIILPVSVKSIGNSAFSNCSKLSSINLSTSVLSIGDFAFSGCTGLTAITIPSSVTSIGQLAYAWCNGSIQVDVNNPVFSSLDGVLFNKNKTTLIQCTASKTGSYNIPSSVTSIGSSAFSISPLQSGGLSSVMIPSSVTSIGDEAFWGCSRITSIIIPSSVTHIGQSAFSECQLNSVIIPSSVNFIGRGAFGYCPLTSVTVKWNTPLDVSSSPDVFYNLNKTSCILYVPVNSKVAYQAANQWKDFTTIVEASSGFSLSASTANIAAVAGSNTTIGITASVAWTASSDQPWLAVSPASGSVENILTFTAQANTSVGTRTAKVTISATGIDSQTISITQAGSSTPLNVTAGGLSTALTAEERAGATRLTLTGTIDARDFKTMRDDMPLLEEIDLTGVTVLAYTGTDGTAGIQYGNFNYPENAVPFIAFMNSGGQGKVSLKKIILPESITSISDQAFNYCSGLNSVNFPIGLVAIGHHAFAYCSGLTTVNIPISVAAIGEGAFSMTKCSFNVNSGNPKYSSSEGLLFNKTQSILIQCPGLQTGDYVIPASVVSIGFDAFAGCNNLTSITIPSSVKSIGQGAFMFCSGISSIHIPSSVTFIGSQSFIYCSGLKSIYANPASPVDLNSSYNVFEGINKANCTLHVPYGTKAAYTVANQWQDFTAIVEAVNGFILSTNAASIAAAAGSTTNVNVTANVIWTASSNQNWLTVSPTSGTGSGQILTLMAQANPLFSTRKATVTVSATDVAPQTITVTQAGMAATAVVKKTAVGPVIDGSIDAVWADANVYTVDKPFTGETPTLGISGQTSWKALWSNEGIYVLIQVTDNNFMPAYKGADPNQNWMYDKPEIYFDVNDLKKDGFGPAAGVGHHIISPNFTEAKNDGTPTTQSDGIVYSLKVTSPDYVGEFFIPFSKLVDKNGNDVVKNGTIGFDITVIDNDMFGPNRNRAVWANDGSASGESYSNMDACGTITLEGAEAEILISNISVTDGTITTDNGTLQMAPTILPLDATNHNLNWTVENNTGKAVINSSGLLTALKNGSVTVKARAKDGSGIEATATVTITGQLIQMDDISLIKNGHFITDGGLPVPWSFYSANGPVPSVVNGVTVCNPIASADAWNYQFYQLGLNALPNTSYTLSFKAWASANRTIGVDFDDPANNYNLYGASTDPEASGGRSWWNLNITTIPATYTLHVVFDQMNPATIQRLIFNLASTSDIVYIDDVSLVSDAELNGLKLSASAITLGATEGSNSTLELTSDVSWNASSDQTWLTVSPISGAGNQTLTFTAQGSTTVAPRFAKVTVSASGFPGSQTVKITQQGSNAPVNLTAGGLKTTFSAQELASISKLTLTGTIDARDFKTMRDEMPLLEEIDLSGVTVLAYTGTDGTAGIQYGNFNYPENAVPFIAFMNSGGQGKVNLKKIILPESITTISDQAFNYCSGLNSVNFPNGLSAIGHHAFAYCSGLTTVNIPVSVAAIGEGAFSMTKCSFNVHSGNPNYSSSEGLLFNKTQSILIQCPGLQTGDYVIPASVVSIGFDAFSGCNNLTSITIPSSVKSIGQGAFMFCSGISSIRIPSSVTFIGSQSFIYCSGLKSIYANSASPVDLSSSYNVFEGVDKTTCTLQVPYGIRSAYMVASQWKDFTNIVEMPGLFLSANSLGMGSNAGTANVSLASSSVWTAVSDQEWLTLSPASGVIGTSSLTFTAAANPTSSIRTAIVTISATGFESQTIKVDQYSKVEVTAGNLKTLLTGQLSTITNLTLSGTINARDFKTMRDEMPVLAGVDLSGVTVVAYSGPEGTASYITVYQANTIPVDAFNKNYSDNITLRSVILPPSITFIDYGAFGTCTALTSISIPLSVESLGDAVFYRCSSLSTIVIPSSVKSIGLMVFYGCRKLVSVTIPSSVKSIENMTFASCSSLAGITIPSSVTSIGESVFDDCRNLTSIILPASITSIKRGAFFNCSNLNSIYTYSKTPIDLSSSSDVFANVNKNTCTLHIPYGTSVLYAAANQWQDFMNLVEMPNLTLSSITVNLEAAQGSKTTIEITSNTLWIVSSDQTWLTVTPTSGTNNSTLTFTAEANTANFPRTATVTISATNIASQNITVTQDAKVSINYHFTPIWTGNGVDHMNINIFSAKLDGLDLEAGDEIGIFDGSLCVGVGVLTGNLSQTNTLDIAVSQNDGSGNGYTPGNTISYRLFDKSKDLEISNLLAVYNSSDPSWSTDGKFAAGLTSFAELSGVTKVNQDITLNTGWNIISANVVPANLNLKDLFQILIDAGKLKKIMDEAGKTIENFGAFGGWKNNIGNLNSAKGYKVNVTAASTLSLEGTPVSLPFDLALAAGWNIISYPSATAQDAKALVQSLIDAGKLKKVMDEAGKTIENFGAFGGWKNNIGNLLPGKGYKVNVTENCTLTIPANGTKAATIVPEVLASTHFTKAFKGNGTDHATINLVNLQASGLHAGDEIGVFDGKLCVGSAMIGSDQLIAGSISIPASANDELGETPNGFMPGNRVSVKLYRESLTYPLTLTKLDGQDIFDKNASLFAQVAIAYATGINDFGNEINFRCYPNPFTEQITIEIQSNSSEKLEVNIYTMDGKLVRKLYNGKAQNQGNLVWDGRNESGTRVVQGIYLINANGRIEKVVLKD